MAQAADIQNNYSSNHQGDLTVPPVQSVAPEYVHSLKELTEKFSLNREAILDLLELSLSERSIVENWLTHYHQRGVINDMMFCEHVGAQLEYEKSLIPSNDRWDYKDLKKANLFRAEVELTNPQKDDFAFFPFEVREIPASLIPKRHGVNPLSTVFGMRIPNEDFKTILRDLKPGPPPFVQNTFGFIRFFNIDETESGIKKIGVIEFRNDLYERLKSRELKEKYKDWAELLLIAFEGYIQSTHQLQRKSLVDTESIEIVFPSLPVISKYWGIEKTPKRDDYVEENPVFFNQETISTEYYLPKYPKAAQRRHFREIPLSAGYTEKKINKKKETLISNSKSDFKFHRGLTKIIQRECKDSTSYPKTIQSGFLSLTTTGYPRIEKWLAVRDKFFPIDLFSKIEHDGYPAHHPREKKFILEGTDITNQVEDSFEIVPTQNIPLTELIGATQKFIDLEKKFQNDGITSLVHKTIPPHFTPISRGIEHGKFEDCFNLPEQYSDGWKVFPIHLKTQNRHPSLRFIRYENGKPQEMISACIKGGGLGDINGFTIHGLENWGKDVRLPIYRRVKIDEDEINVDNSSLRHWGGMHKSEAENTHMQLLAIHDLISSTDSGLTDLLPTPLSIHKIQSLPVWKKDTTEWLGVQEYASRYLNETYGYDDYFCTAHTVSHCDVRISQLVKRIFTPNLKNSEDTEERAMVIMDAVKFLYFTNGFEVNFGGVEWPKEQGMNKSTQILHFLKQIQEQNPLISKLIFQNIVHRSLKIIGTVHGANGDLGGGGEKGHGADYGGAVAIRNMDLRGGLNDIDSGCYFPWAPQSRFRVDTHISARSIKDYKQSLDLLYWRESMYWIGMVLNSTEQKQVNGSIKIQGTPSDDFTMLSSTDTQTKTFKRLCHRFKKGKVDQEKYLPEKELKYIYTDSLEKGKSFTPEY